VDLGLAGQVVLVTGAGQWIPERLAKLTAAYPLRRLGRPEDVPPVVLLLASPLTSWVTGQVLSVNGGYAMV
jgi:3-oxoacyl-[acyl-carrier protein] reductase